VGERTTRLKEQAIEDEGEMVAILKKVRYVTLAMCQDEEPYLATVSHGYDGERNAIYFHCAFEGKKIDILKANNVVWGEAVDDLGTKEGECSQRYATTHFRGTVTFVEDLDEKRHGLSILISAFGDDPDKFFEKPDSEERLEKLNIGRVDIDHMSGKRSMD
jgi:nitroimidazol reductase NimA-like FMN-containing flavoprotein (pyridoxamine 5'-phosphate oxidase superfamily)